MKTCACGCKRQFESNRHTHRFATARCRKRAFGRKRPAKPRVVYMAVCSVCPASIAITSRTMNRKTCSDACRNKAHRMKKGAG